MLRTFVSNMYHTEMPTNELVLYVGNTLTWANASKEECLPAYLQSLIIKMEETQPYAKHAFESVSVDFLDLFTRGVVEGTLDRDVHHLWPILGGFNRVANTFHGARNFQYFHGVDIVVNYCDEDLELLSALGMQKNLHFGSNFRLIIMHTCPEVDMLESSAFKWAQDTFDAVVYVGEKGSLSSSASLFIHDLVETFAIAHL